MKIVFFSDAHGNQYTINKFFEKMNLLKPDLLIFGGDIFGYYYGQKEIIKRLRESKCVCLLGNHDQYFLDLLSGKLDEDYLVSRYGTTYQLINNKISNEDVIFLKELKSRYDVQVDGLKLVFVHGSITDPLNGRIYPDTDILNIDDYTGIDFVFSGHTHHKMVRHLVNGTTIINPGSIGQQRDGKGCTYLIFDTVDRTYTYEEIHFNKDLLISEIYQHNENIDMTHRLIEVLNRNK